METELLQFYVEHARPYTQEYLNYVNKIKTLVNFTDEDEDVLGYENSIVIVKDANLESIWHSKSERNIVFKNCNFHTIIYSNSNYRNIYIDCNFSDCEFNKANFTSCSFYNCQFDVDISSSKFQHCTISKTSFNLLSEPSSKKTPIKSAKDTEKTSTNNLFSQVNFFNCKLDDVSINNTILLYCTFSNMFNENKSILTIDNSSISACTYSHCDLSKSILKNSLIGETSFINCNLNNETFTKSVTDSNSNRNFIDFQSILQSDLNKDSLALFGIHSDEVKEYVESMVTEVKFQSVFISYSFKDKLIANSIRNLFMKHGVPSFLWERDAPGGKRLKKIMAENIQKHERLLFIASENSLQSEACQYELKEAREKQTKEWKDIYYPIHIDNYLFEVRKEDIPRKHREDFWENIEEVKEFHSKDFTVFKTEEDLRSHEFETAVMQLIKDLKL